MWKRVRICMLKLGFNPLNPTIKMWILICCPYSFPCRSSGEKLIKYQANSSCVIMFVILSHARGHLRVSRFARRTTEKRETARSLFSWPLCLTKHWYYKEKFDADHSKGLHYVSGIWISPPIPLWLLVDWAVKFSPISAKRKRAWM